MSRRAKTSRRTKETGVEIEIDLDGRGEADVSTGLPFLDHMLTLFAVHGLFDLKVEASGDLEVDGHHTVEDIGIVLGQAIDQALGDRAGIYRYGWAYLPMDESLARVALDLSGRSYLVFDVDSPTEWVGRFETQLMRDFFEALAAHGRMTLHAASLYGVSGHHVFEAVFKAFGRALRMACAKDPGRAGVPSSKGVL